jgi:hypothetical protein
MSENQPMRELLMTKIFEEVVFQRQGIYSSNISLRAASAFRLDSHVLAGASTPDSIPLCSMPRLPSTAPRAPLLAAARLQLAAAASCRRGERALQ